MGLGLERGDDGMYGVISDLGRYDFQELGVRFHVNIMLQVEQSLLRRSTRLRQWSSCGSVIRNETKHRHTLLRAKSTPGLPRV